MLARALLLIAGSLLLAFSPPSGRPPIGPLERTEPRLYDITFEVRLNTLVSRVNEAERAALFVLKDAPILLPIIPMGTYSAVDLASLNGEVFGDNGPLTNIRRELSENQPFHTQHVVMTIPEYRGASLRWKVTYRAQMWSSRLNEAEAMKLTWPRDWPDDVQDGLKPQQFIESDAEVFQKALESQGGVTALRTVSPLIAAKQVIAYCLNNMRVSGNGLFMRDHGLLEGMEMVGARQAAENGLGSPHDLVAVCVAMLRAANIPARPVIGLEANQQGRLLFKTWAEFYLPDAGWVPFDPHAMLGKGVGRMNVQRVWPEFGTFKDLNRRLTLSYHFHPPAAVETRGGPGVWGWNPGPNATRYYELSLHFISHSRGAGVDPAR